METTSYLDEVSARIRAAADALVVPKREEGSVRDIMEAHLTHLVDTHNGEIAAKIHYLQTGEVVEDSIRPWSDMVERSSAKDISFNINRIRQYAIDLNYALHSVDEISQFTELSHLSPFQFVEFYNRMLLQMRAMHLPD